MRASKLKLFIIVLVVFLAAAVVVSLAWPNTSEAPGNEHNPLAPGYHTVTDVIDGDTIKVDIDGRSETVRLIGINSPELPDECFAQVASSVARKILAGQQIKLEADKTQDNRDRYGRLLRYVILSDGTNFNRLMVTEGYAREYTFITPYKFQSEFKEVQNAAKEKERGLWSPAACKQ